MKSIITSNESNGGMKKKPNDLWIILALMVTIVIDLMGIGLVFPLIPQLIIAEHSLLIPFDSSETYRHIAYGIAMAAWPLGLFFGTPYFGQLSDKYGRKKILIISLLGTTCAYILSALAINWGSYSLFVVSRLASGLFASSFVIAQAVIADISPNDKKARNMGWITVAATAGLVFGPAITTFTAIADGHAWFSIVTPFWIAAIISLLNMISLWLLLSETYSTVKPEKINFLEGVTSFKFIFSDMRTRGLAICFFLLQLGWGFFTQGIPLVLLGRFGFDSGLTGSFFMVIGLSCFLAILFLQPKLLQLASLKSISIGGSLVAGLAVSFVFLLPTVPTVWAIAFVAASAQILAYNVSLVAFSNAVSEQEQGIAMGGTGAIFGVAWMSNAIILGIASAWHDLLPIVFATMGLMLAGVYRVLFVDSKQSVAVD